jgi:hypothetical protein
MILMFSHVKMVKQNPSKNLVNFKGYLIVTFFSTMGTFMNDVT